MKLIPLSDFVLMQEVRMSNPEIFKSKVYAYAKFLKQPLTLGMFVPVDEEGNPYDLNEVEAWKNQEHYSRFYKEELAFFEDAKEKVLFEGFEPKPAVNEVFNETLKLTIYLQRFQFMNVHENGLGGGDLIDNKIEALAHADLGIELTPSALEAIGIKE